VAPYSPCYREKAASESTGRAQMPELQCFNDDIYVTLIKKKIKFSSYKGNSEWSSCNVIDEEGLRNIWENAQIFPHI
jgi:hypothetical protein